MKRTVYLLSTLLLVGSLQSCTNMSTRGYLGTMAGAEIGGTIGEAIGWMSTSRHSGPGKAMLGSVIGTVAGAAIGHQLATSGERKNRESYDNYSGSSRYENETNYQTGGGYDNGYASNYSSHKKHHTHNEAKHSGYHIQNSAQLSIRGLTYQDEDGDGRFGRGETINVIYEVTNNGQTPAQVELVIDDPTHPNNFAFSPANNVTIQPGQTIRYKAKAFCQSRPKTRTCDLIVYAKSITHGNATGTMRVKVD